MARTRRAPWEGLPVTLKAGRLGLYHNAQSGETMDPDVQDGAGGNVIGKHKTHEEASAFLDGIRWAWDKARQVDAARRAA